MEIGQEVLFSNLLTVFIACNQLHQLTSYILHQMHCICKDLCGAVMVSNKHQAVTSFASSCCGKACCLGRILGIFMINYLS